MLGGNQAMKQQPLVIDPLVANLEQGVGVAPVSCADRFGRERTLGTVEISETLQWSGSPSSHCLIHGPGDFAFLNRLAYLNAHP